MISDCESCRGTGIGYAPDSPCPVCGGSGICRDRPDNDEWRERQREQEIGDTDIYTEYDKSKGCA